MTVKELMDFLDDLLDVGLITEESDVCTRDRDGDLTDESSTFLGHDGTMVIEGE